MRGQFIPAALSLRKTRELWQKYGGTVHVVRRSGEERYSHTNIERPLTVNRRRKDAPRKLIAVLRRVAALRLAA